MESIEFETNPDGGVNLYVNDVFISPKRSQKVWNHSPDGFNIGYHGSGPAQTALAILMCFTIDNNDLAVRLHQDFKREFVANWEVGTVYYVDVDKWIEEHK